ncbi:hypothetical protein OIE61_29195 [Streptomyces sp. NBC_01762]|uniref:hypothetical protein n=1 Tax=unclassified Streptomyces TaxID=2593676 RepID=UPI002DD7C4F6|nr:MULTISPECIES: hypothetical protein [unclassified Streptomyces]WSC47706.1 hypothetical protein OIE61_29195 [Streptomyces sp. NBC_01762]WSD27358.1 hypothetical protein OHA26_29905 [Streptomyces sp. NBC_01751]WSJ50717.1 hypothetical protein OG243_14875 [Streptomyces sp. NBC_01318]
MTGTEFGVPGIQPVAEPVTYWVLYDDGSSGRTESTTGEPTLTSPGRLVTEAEYQARVDELKAANDAYVAEIQAEDEARQRQDFEALVASGLPDATARRLSGYEGQPDTETPEGD